MILSLTRLEIRNLETHYLWSYTGGSDPLYSLAVEETSSGGTLITVVCQGGGGVVGFLLVVGSKNVLDIALSAKQYLDAPTPGQPYISGLLSYLNQRWYNATANNRG